MFKKETRHNLGSLNLSRCLKKDNMYEKSAKQAREGVVRKHIVEIVKNAKSRLYE